MYKTVVIGYLPKADDMAQKVEEKANEMIQVRNCLWIRKKMLCNW